MKPFSERALQLPHAQGLQKLFLAHAKPASPGKVSKLGKAQVAIALGRTPKAELSAALAELFRRRNR